VKIEFPVRRAFLTGLLFLTPLVVTGWVLVTLFRTVDNWLQPMLLRAPFLRDRLPEEGITGIGVLAVVLLVLLVGLFASNLIGRAFFGALDRVVRRIPMIKGLYGATKDLSTVLFTDRRAAFRKVVLFEYPRRGSWAIGFVTNEMGAEDGGKIFNIFLPTTPNPTSGYFLMIPADDTTLLDISIEDGIKLVVSGGAVLSRANHDVLVSQLRSPAETVEPPSA